MVVYIVHRHFQMSVHYIYLSTTESRQWGTTSQMYHADAWLPVITTVIIGCILPMMLLIGNEFA